VRARKIVARYAASDQPVYGLTTGLGGNLQHPNRTLKIFQLSSPIAAGPQCRRRP
jgi:histidine ammonia-lyase